MKERWLRLGAFERVLYPAAIVVGTLRMLAGTLTLDWSVALDGLVGVVLAASLWEAQLLRQDKARLQRALEVERLLRGPLR